MHPLTLGLFIDGPITDLQAILALASGAEFITQEVDYASGDIQPADYQVIGDVTESVASR